jgi:hypothetical protein
MKQGRLVDTHTHTRTPHTRTHAPPTQKKITVNHGKWRTKGCDMEGNKFLKKTSALGNCCFNDYYPGGVCIHGGLRPSGMVKGISGYRREQKKFHNDERGPHEYHVILLDMCCEYKLLTHTDWREADNMTVPGKTDISGYLTIGQRRGDEDVHLPHGYELDQHSNGKAVYLLKSGTSKK